MMKRVIVTLLILCVSFSSISQDYEERYIIKKLSVNNVYSNFGTAFYGEDKMIFAMPAKRSYIVNNVWKPNNQPFLDLYIGEISSNGELINVKKFSSTLNTRFHEADVTFTKDKKTVYFTRSNYFNGRYGKDSLGVNRLKMFKASVGFNGEWLNIKPMPFNDDNYSVGHPSLSQDQKTLYFISDMPGTLGKTDIFKVVIDEDGTYGIPVNLGSDVNTSGREMFPFIDGNDELYYSTDGRDDGLGMLDIYMSKLSPDDIQPPIHLGSNINSEKDDFAFIIQKEKRIGYFSSNRSNGKRDNIFYFKEEKPMVFECNQDINIIVKNGKTGETVPNALISIFKDGEVLIDGAMANKKGTYQFIADCNTGYKIESSKEFFVTSSKFFETSNKNKLEEDIILNLSPKEFVVVREKVIINLNPIYFDFGKFNINRDASLELDKVVEIMKKYPKLTVESGSHTDSRGLNDFNDMLSIKRANSTVDYIISNGISPNRISGGGYGENQLTNKCSDGIKCSEVEHQLNRRTEFVIVNPEVINM